MVGGYAVEPSPAYPVYLSKYIHDPWCTTACSSWDEFTEFRRDAVEGLRQFLDARIAEDALEGASLSVVTANGGIRSA